MSHAEQLDKVVVAKIGTSTLVDATGRPDAPFVSSLCDQIAELVSEGYHVVMVTSGAVACGMELLGFDHRPNDMPSLQACAAAGQVGLVELYADGFARHGIPCAQVLLTRNDTSSREAYLNARNTLVRLLELGAVPVLNENDTVAVEEFTFGDNDSLGVIVATLVGAGLYVILSDVDGLHTANPSRNPAAPLVDHVSHVDSGTFAMAGGAGTALGTGGMTTKVRAGRAALAAGIPMVVCDGRREHVLVDVVHGEQLGTRFSAKGVVPHENARKLWIGLAGVPRGSVTVDAGCARALREEGASLLPVGVTGCSGGFSAGDVVNVLSPEGELVGRGACRYSAIELERARGLKLDVIARFMPEKAGQPCIHRDELLVL